MTHTGVAQGHPSALRQWKRLHRAEGLVRGPEAQMGCMRGAREAGHPRTWFSTGEELASLGHCPWASSQEDTAALSGRGADLPPSNCMILGPAGYTTTGWKRKQENKLDLVYKETKRGKPSSAHAV